MKSRIRALFISVVIALAAASGVFASGFSAGAIPVGSGMIAVAATNHVIYSNGASWTSRTLSDGIDAELTYFGDSSVAEVGDMLWRDSGRWSLIRGQAHNPAGVLNGYFLKNDNGTPSWADASAAFQGGALGSTLTWSSGLGAITHVAGPTDQPHKIRGGTNTGTNATGRDMDLGGGLGTGTGVPGYVQISTGYTGTSGTTAHAEGIRVWKISKTYSPVDGATTVYFTVPLSSGQMTSFFVQYTARVHSTTPHSSVLAGRVAVAGYNISGTASGTVSSAAPGVLHTTLGTFTATSTVANNGGNLEFRMAVDSNLASQDLLEVNLSVESDTPGFTLTPS